MHLFRPKGMGDRGDCSLGLGDLWDPWLQLSQVLKSLEAAAHIHRRGGGELSWPKSLSVLAAQGLAIIPLPLSQPLLRTGDQPE